jgi:inositol polyphosphate 5-phosphatase INPP5B/F
MFFLQAVDALIPESAAFDEKNNSSFSVFELSVLELQRESFVAHVDDDQYAKKTVILSIVMNKKAPLERAIFLFLKRKGTLQFLKIIPVRADIRINVFGTSFLEVFLQSTGDMIRVKMLDRSMADTVVTELKECHSIACREQLSSRSSSLSHSWLDHYEFYQSQVRAALRRQRTRRSVRSSSYHLLTQSVTQSDMEFPLVDEISGLSDDSEDDPSGDDVQPVGVSSFVMAEMDARRSEYAEARNLTVFVGTWNVAEKNAPETLQPWIRPGVADVYVVGFQEVDMTPLAVVTGESSRARPWEQALMRTLNVDEKYVVLKSKQFGGVYLGVFVRLSLRDSISDIDITAKPVGLGGQLANKGAVVCRFQLDSSSLCFVCAHLAAHQKAIERRNQDYFQILSSVQLLRIERPCHILDHDYVFWLGDLNYRIDIEDGEVRELIKESNWPALFEGDQLRVQQANSRAFSEFVEGRIDFAPTYRYDKKTGEIEDPKTAEKKRTPAWCDRILFRGQNVRQLTYDSSKLVHSDHMPVFSVFDCTLYKDIPALKSIVYDSVLKAQDALENSHKPDVELSLTSVDFGEVRLFEERVVHIVVTNKGDWCDFAFKRALGRESLCKPWLHVSPTYGFIPKDGQVKITLRVQVTGEHSFPIISNADPFRDLLIFHLRNGRDYFIEAAGTLLPSSFGVPLEFLCCEYRPIRCLKLNNLGTLPLRVPKELWSMIDFIVKNGMSLEQLFDSSPNPADVVDCIEMLDHQGFISIPSWYVSENTNSVLSKEVDAYTVAATLVTFLVSLSPPVVPPEYYDQCVHSPDLVASKQLVAQFPLTHQNVFKYLVSFLKYYLATTSDTSETAQNIGAIFGNAVLRAPSDAYEFSFMDQTDRAQFLTAFLLDSDTWF